MNKPILVLCLFCANASYAISPANQAALKEVLSLSFKVKASPDGYPRILENYRTKANRICNDAKTTDSQCSAAIRLAKETNEYYIKNGTPMPNPPPMPPEKSGWQAAKAPSPTAKRMPSVQEAQTYCKSLAEKCKHQTRGCELLGDSKNEQIRIKYCIQEYRQ